MSDLVERHLSVGDVRQALAQPLPGLAAQMKMAPQPRPGWSYTGIPADCRQSGVLMLLYPREERLHFALTRRTERVGAHKGQVSLPGGACHNNELPVETALRETAEELGVDSRIIEVIGQLTPLYVPVSNYCIHPFIGYQPSVPDFRLDPVEVAEALEMPLTALLDPRNRQVEYWHEADFEGGRRIPCFRLRGWLVWGATAMILSEIATVLENSGNVV
jgi:8-oxo-dGTP pyrophosphatase MutT (NUDIX family)